MDSDNNCQSPEVAPDALVETRGRPGAPPGPSAKSLRSQRISVQASATHALLLSFENIRVGSTKCGELPLLHRLLQETIDTIEEISDPKEKAQELTRAMTVVTGLYGIALKASQVDSQADSERRKRLATARQHQQNRRGRMPVPQQLLQDLAARALGHKKDAQ